MLIRTVTVLVFLLPVSLIAGEKETITVKSGSVNGNVVLIDAELGGKPVQLECFLSAALCKIPKQDSYLLVRLPPGKGTYTDCTNADLYEESASQTPQTRIGEYCLLGS